MQAGKPRLLLLCMLCTTPAFGTMVMSWPSTAWRAVTLASGNPLDYFADQQTGQAAGDIVGTLQDGGLFTMFDPTGTPTIAFRVRLAAFESSGFSRGFFIGIDANGDGILDLFVGVDNTGSAANRRIKIFSPGSGLNDSPNTTTMAVPSNQKVYLETVSNYDYQVLDAIIDPYGTSPFDLDGGNSGVDAYLSFSIPYGDLASEMSRLSGITIDANSPLRFISVTSTQNNSFNQDLGGVNGGVNSSQTWTQLGAYSVPYNPSDLLPIPEPGTFELSALSVLISAISARTARKGHSRSN